MHEQAPMLQATRRDRVGSRYARRLRDQGQLPAIVYGHGEDPVPVAIDARTALGYIKKGEKVFRLDYPGQNDGAEGHYVLLKDVQFDYLGTHIVHADFARVSLDERVHTRVPLHLIGEAKGLKTAGAILIHPTTEIEIECLVAAIPDKIDVDISEVDVGHAITAADVVLPDPNMKLLEDPHAIVAQVLVQVEQKVAEAATVEAAPAAPEVIGKKKEEEEEKEE